MSCDHDFGNHNLATMTVYQLRSIARQLDIAGRSTMRRAELVTAIAANPRWQWAAGRAN
jgi:hypothetical protein